MYGLDDGSYWTAANDRVWEVLEPCLQLSAMFLNNINLWACKYAEDRVKFGHWLSRIGWDALFYGEYKLLDQKLFRPSANGAYQGKQAYSFHRRPPIEMFQDQERSRQMLESMAGKIMFRLFHDRTHPSTQLAGEQGFPNKAWGVTSTNELYDNITISINYHLLQRLMRQDLNVSLWRKYRAHGH